MLLETKLTNENYFENQINTMKSQKIEDKDEHTQLPKERKKLDFLEVKTPRTNMLEIISREKVDGISISASSRIVIINESNEPNVTEDNKSSSEVLSNMNMKLEESYH